MGDPATPKLLQTFKQRNLKSCQPSQTFLWTMRGFVVIVMGTMVLFREALQSFVNESYSYLLGTWLFNSVYFETYWQFISFLPVSLVPYITDKISYFDQYKIDSKVTWVSPGIWGNIVEAFVYVLPLMLLDTFMVKKYTGVDPSEWIIRRRNWIQHTRALPIHPPSILQIVYQLVVAFLLYDFVFCLFHYAMHKNRWLYKYVHSYHHDHKELHTRVTNQLTVAERIFLILSANEALKITGSHPLTRLIFVPIFQAWLVDNHCGYSFPWSLDKLVPFGLVGGPVKHYAHHVYGDRYYAPFFTYIDQYIIGKFRMKQPKATD